MRDHAERLLRQNLVDVSRETWNALDMYVAALMRWNKTINLVSSSTLEDVWLRHIADSLQLLSHITIPVRNMLDIGSGAGLPGLVMGVALHRQRNLDRLTLIESDRRKAVFLSEMMRLLDLPGEVLSARVESLTLADLPDVDLITARALAPLPRLLLWSQVWLEAGAVGLFHKGASLDAEQQAISDSARWNMQSFPSIIDGHSRIVRVTWQPGRDIHEA